MQALIVLFLLGVAVFGLIVTFPWGIALLLLWSIWHFGLKGTAELTSSVIWGSLGLIVSVLVGILGIVLLFVLLAAVLK